LRFRWAIPREPRVPQPDEAQVLPKSEPPQDDDDNSDGETEPQSSARQVPEATSSSSLAPDDDLPSGKRPTLPEGYPRFQFAKPGPGGRPVTNVAEALRRRRRTQLPVIPREHPIPSWDEECASYLQEDWSAQYEGCPEFGAVWRRVHSPSHV
jgi:hypothetical protein